MSQWSVFVNGHLAKNVEARDQSHAWAQAELAYPNKPIDVKPNYPLALVQSSHFARRG